MTLYVAVLQTCKPSGFNDPVLAILPDRHRLRLRDDASVNECRDKIWKRHSERSEGIYIQLPVQVILTDRVSLAL